jgi:hypothetical protein
LRREQNFRTKPLQAWLPKESSDVEESTRAGSAPNAKVTALRACKLDVSVGDSIERSNHRLYGVECVWIAVEFLKESGFAIWVFIRNLDLCNWRWPGPSLVVRIRGRACVPQRAPSGMVYWRCRRFIARVETARWVDRAQSRAQLVFNGLACIF